MRFLFFFFIYLLISCKGGQQNTQGLNVTKILSEVNNAEHIPLIKFDTPDSIRQISFQNFSEHNLVMEQLIDTMYIVPLETTEYCLVGYINDLAFDEDKIIIASGTKPDDDSRAELLVFDMKGNFLNKVGRYGRAEEEYSSYNTFSILNHEIYIFDRIRSCFKIYAEDGTYIRTHKLPAKWYPTDVYIINDSTLLWYWGEGTKYILNGEMTHYTHMLTDMIGNPIAKAFYYERTFISSHKNNYEEDHLLLAPFGIDTLYRVTANRKFEVRYVLDIPNKINDKKRNYSQENLWQLNRAGKTYLAGGFWVNNSHMLGRVINMEPTFFIYDLQSNKGIKYNSVYMTNGKNKSYYDLCNHFNISAIYNNYFVSFLQATEVVSSMNKLENTDDIAIKKQLKAVKLDDNPLLVFYKFKSI